MKIFKKMLVATFVVATFSGAASAETSWAPDKAIKLQIGFGAGGSTDTLGRALAMDIEKATGWTVVAENKPGGGGIAMFSSMLAAKPDGLTIGLGVSTPIWVNLAKRAEELPFDIDSFTYIASITEAPKAIAVRADSQFTNFSDLLEKAKSDEGLLVGSDSPTNEMLLSAVTSDNPEARFKLVSHNSGAEVITSLLGGHVEAGFVDGAHIPYVKSGDLKLVATATKTAHSYAPKVGSMSEQGYDYVVRPIWYIAAPKDLPEDIRTALTDAVQKAMASESTAAVIQGAFNSEPLDMNGPATRDMLIDGLTSIKDMVEKAK
ncbi:tripartite tricarboxylate transporter substrate binding protein [Celeribacter sp. ULVN23_4]